VSCVSIFLCGILKSSLYRYEMYAGESRVSSMTPVDPNGPGDQQNSKAEQGAADSGPALEVIQLANGETIWSVCQYVIYIAALTPYQVYCQWSPRCRR
jgi:hypothetical protein